MFGFGRGDVRLLRISRAGIVEAGGRMWRGGLRGKRRHLQACVSTWLGAHRNDVLADSVR